MSELQSRINMTRSDVAWSIVFSRENRSTLSALSLVSKQFLLLATAEDLFRSHVVRLEVSPYATISQIHPLPWRRAYRRMRALEFASRATFHECRVLRSSQEEHPLLLLWSCTLTECAVFFDTSNGSLVGWPKQWCLEQVAQSHSAVTIRSAIVSLSTGVMGILSMEDSKLIMVVLSGRAGTVLARNIMELDCVLCTTWAAALANSPWALKAAGNGIVVCTLREILYVDSHTGMTLKRWPRGEIGDTLAFFVRGESNDCLIGYQSIIFNKHVVRSIVDDSVLAEIDVGADERVIDIVLNADRGILACRVVSSESRIICILFLKESVERSSHYVAKVRTVLHSDSTIHVATTELMVQRSMVLYKPDMSRPFPGPIVAIVRRQGEDTFCSLRCIGERFLSALATSTEETLVTCNDSEVQLYRLSSGECVAAHRYRGVFGGLFRLGVPTHAIGVFAGNSLTLVHFSAFCGSIDYPSCASRLP